MSSKFSSSFLSKSPLLAGGYASGVDGMRYVSPKQPENKSVPSPKVKKKEKEKEIPELGDGFDFTIDPEIEKLIKTPEDVVNNRIEVAERSGFKKTWNTLNDIEKAKHGNNFETFKKKSQDYITDYEKKNGEGSWNTRRTKETDLPTLGTRTREFEQRNKDPEIMTRETFTGDKTLFITEEN